MSRPADLEVARERLDAVLKAIADGRIAAVRERDRLLPVPDGYRTATLGDGMPSGSGDVSRPTEAAAIALADPTERGGTVAEKALRGDYVHRCAEAVERGLEALEYHAGQVLGYLAEVERLEAKHRGRTTDQAPGAGSCTVCERWCSGADGDRIKAGYCPTDYQAWNRAGRPDRLRWELRRKRELAARERRRQEAENPGVQPGAPESTDTATQPVGGDEPTA